MLDRRMFLGVAAAAGSSLILPGVVQPVQAKLTASRLPVGTIVPTMDSTWQGVPHYRILVDGDYWLPTWIPGYFLQVRQFPEAFALFGYSHGRRDLYGPDGEFALPYIKPGSLVA